MAQNTKFWHPIPPIMIQAKKYSYPILGMVQITKFLHPISSHNILAFLVVGKANKVPSAFPQKCFFHILLNSLWYPPGTHQIPVRYHKKLFLLCVFCLICAVLLLLCVCVCVSLSLSLSVSLSSLLLLLLLFGTLSLDSIVFSQQLQADDNTLGSRMTT